ncbi:MAG: UDP-N-acetylmuramate dehydrogenase [Patescibacteria group bacterium]|nr:UDP-N-acetylmuramate dehydrogenase [Patescibacteria group bacterium]
MWLEKNRKLADFTTFKLGGPADFLVKLKKSGKLKKFLEWFDQTERKNLPILILGGGSNLLINDQGYRGLIVKPEFNLIELLGEKIVKVESGAMMTELIEFVANQGLAGLEWAGGLPGTVGGAVRGNAGCFGGEIKDQLIEVEALNFKTKKVEIFENQACQFSYRQSFFKQNPEWLILSAKFIFNQNKSPLELKKIISEKIFYRQNHHPLGYPNAGSIFKNIPLVQAGSKLKDLAEKKGVIKNDPFPLIPTAFVINELGLKGCRFGGAMVSDKHTNFIVNFNQARTTDVVVLINLIKTKVKNEFNFDLEEEIKII